MSYQSKPEGFQEGLQPATDPNEQAITLCKMQIQACEKRIAEIKGNSPEASRCLIGNCSQPAMGGAPFCRVHAPVVVQTAPGEAVQSPTPLGLTPADMETMAEAVHDAYLETCARLGWGVKPENQVPYSALSEDSKELDRASVRAVLRFVAPKGRTFWIEASEAEGKTFYGQIYAHPGPGRIQMVEVQPAKAPPELKGAREADIWRGRVVDYTNILASRFAGEISTEAAIQRLDAMAIADCKRIARPDLPLEVLPPESPTAEARKALDAYCAKTDLEKEFHYILLSLRANPAMHKEPGIRVLRAAERFEKSLAGAKPGARDTKPDEFYRTISEIANGRLSTPLTGTTGDTPVSPNRYGVDVGYFHAELAALSKSLPDRPAAELSRYLQKLANVAAPVSLVSPAPVLRPLEEFIPELLELARGEDHDQEGCPQDDTCRCANIAKLEAELKAIQRMRAGAPAPQPIPPEAGKP